MKQFTNFEIMNKNLATVLKLPQQFLLLTLEPIKKNMINLTMTSNKPTYEELEKEIKILQDKLEKQKVIESNMQVVENLAKIGHWDWDYEKGILSWSDEIFNIFGVDKETFVVSAQNFESTIHPDDIDFFMKELEIALNANNDISIIHRIIKPNGIISTVHERATIIRKNNKPIRLIGTIQDITEQKNIENKIIQSKEEAELYNERLESLLRVSQFPTNSIQELLDFSLSEVINLTESKIGYIYFYNETTKQFTLNTWSKEVMPNCSVVNPQSVYDLDKTGCWGEAVRQRKPIILNDYQSENPIKKGTPEGHIKLTKFLTIPVIFDDKIVAVAGVANKETNYNNSDVRQLTLLMDNVWKISDRIQLISKLKTAVEKAEESEHKFRSYIENAPDGIIVIQNEGKYLEVNPELCKMFGYTKEEFLNNNYKIPIIAEEEYSKARKSVEKILIEGKNVDEFRFVRKNKTFFYGLMSSVRISNNHTLTFIKNIDNIKNTQQDLIIAKEKAEESDRLKSAFLQNMSHEVRTPLNAIVGFSQLITKSNQTPEKIIKFSEMISEGSEKLIGVITDVIEISQIQSKITKPKLTEFDIISFLNAITNNFKNKAIEKNIDLKIKIDVNFPEYFIQSDKEKLNRIFFHLIDNAIKFTTHGIVNIVCELENENIKFAITDTGIGISEEMQKIIFEPFRQVETGICRNFGGNGLGLSLVKAYTELLNGSISLKSEINKGTTFYISIPTNKVSLQIPEILTDDKKYKVNTILIVEDEYSNYQYLLALLEETKLEILYAENGKKAVDMCRANAKIDLILMDIKMPIMDGHTSAKLIKGFRSDIPIIAQTAYALESERETFIGIFDDYITKPISEELLNQKLFKYIGK